MSYSWDAGGGSASATLSSTQEKALNEAKPFSGIPTKADFVDDVVFLKDVSMPDGKTYFLEGDEVKALGQGGGNVTGIITGSGDTLPTAAGNKDNYFLLKTDDGANKAGIYKSDDANWTVAALFGSDDIDTDAGEAWKADTDYKAGEAFTFSTTNTTAVDINGKEIKPNTTLIGAYKVDTTSGGSLTNTEMAKFELVSGGADEATFLTLPDTFNDFTGKANFIVRVNLAENAIEAVELLASMSKYDDTVTQFGLSAVDLNTQKAIEKLKELVDNLPDQITVNDIAERDALVDVDANTIVHVKDASADTTVAAGWCKYQYIDGAWFKYLAEEDLSVLDLNDTWKDPANANYATKGSTSFKQLDDTFTRKDDFKLHTFRALMHNSIHSDGDVIYSGGKLSIDDITLIKLPTGATWNIDALTDFVVDEHKVVYFDTSKEEVLQGNDKSIPQSALKTANVDTFMPTADNFQIGYVANGKFHFVSGQSSIIVKDLINHITAVATTTDGTFPAGIPKYEKVYATNTNDIYVSNGDDSFRILDKSTFDEYMLLEVKDTKSIYHFNKDDGTFVESASGDRLITQSFTFPANKDLEAFMADDTYFPKGHNGIFKTTEDITVTANSMNVYDNLKTVQIGVSTYDIPKNSIGTIKKESNGVITVVFTTAGILDPEDTGIYLRTKQDDGSTAWASVEMVGESSTPVIEEYSLQPADGTNDDVWHEISSSSFTMNVGMEYMAEVKAKMRTMNVIRELKLEIVNNNTGARHLVGFDLLQDASDSADTAYDKGIENTHIIGRFAPQENGEYTLVFSRRNTSARSRPWFFTGQESANYTDIDSNLELRVVRVKGITESTDTTNKDNTITACGNQIDLALGAHYDVTATATQMTAINPVVGQGGNIKITNCENITGWSADFVLLGELATATLTGVNRFAYFVEADGKIVVGWVQ